MKLFLSIQLLFLACVGYANCWYYAQEQNVCQVLSDKSKVVYSKVLTQLKDGSLSYQWLPRKQMSSYKKKHCCPGWGSYVKFYGCWEKLKCQVSLPQKASLKCKEDRNKQLEAERLFYIYKETKSPTDPTLVDNEIVSPMLDQDLATVIRKYQLDETESHWFNMYFPFFGVEIQKMTALADMQFPSVPFATYAQFLEVFEFYTEQIKLVNHPSVLWYRQDPSKVLDIFSNDKWMEDKYFAMRRLVYYPNNMQRVNLYGGLANNFFALKAQLNPIFDWDSEIKKVTGMNFYMSVFYGLVHVVDHAMLSGIPYREDITDDPSDSRTMRGPITPIAVFAVGKDALGKCELKAVAIQRDRATTSHVFTPSDGDRWLIMKMEFESGEFLLHQLGYHLTEHHLTMERICLSMHRHFPTLHPLRQILERHCIGTLGVNSNGIGALLGDQKIAHKLFGVGNYGSATVSNRVFKNLKWKDLDFMERMKKAGTLDHKLFPYHPYRDDGALIYNAIKNMASDYVDVYYKTDVDVSADTELQSYANEVSLQGITGPDAGKGKFDGFPNTVLTKIALKQIITRIIWIVAEHSEAGYVLADFSAFVPYGPGKVYEDANIELTPVQSLGDSAVAKFQGSSVAVLSGLHYDVLFDYGKFVLDKKGRDVVDKYHTHLMTITKPIIEKRNVERLAKQQFSYPYFLPGFMPNSISV